MFSLKVSIINWRNQNFWSHMSTHTFFYLKLLNILAKFFLQNVGNYASQLCPNLHSASFYDVIQIIPFILVFYCLRQLRQVWGWMCFQLKHLIIKWHNQNFCLPCQPTLFLPKVVNYIGKVFCKMSAILYHHSVSHLHWVSLLMW